MDDSGWSQTFVSSIYFLVLMVQIGLAERKIIFEIRKLSKPDKDDKP